MRIANLAGRLTLITGDAAVDVEKASGGDFGPDPQSVYERWAALAVIGQRAYQVPAADALAYVAGYAVGQDISERQLQLAPTPPQFSLGKSLPGFGPIGPWLVTLDEFDDPNDLELGCAIDGEQVQLSRTRELIFSVPALVSHIEGIGELRHRFVASKSVAPREG